MAIEPARYRLKRQELALARQKEAAFEERRLGLPHIYGYKWYAWGWRFFTSTNKVNLLTAANQIGKSTVQIRKCLDWATNKAKWPTLWPKSVPRQFWYLYPSKDVASVEFKEKWVPELMPCGRYKDDEVYGWKDNYDNKKKIESVEFNSGVTIYFKTYGQDVSNLQSGSCHALFTDEEVPVDLLDELMLRISAANIDGYFHMVFTATLNQDFWRRAIEPKRNEVEVLPDAFKLQISMYDCLTYMDGTPSPWTEELIEQVTRRCKNPQEVQRRVFGRFITETGRAFPTYNADVHFIKPKLIPHDWTYYSGIDHGGGGSGHPAAISFVAMNPAGTLGYVFRGWRGDGILTTAGDTLDKWRELRGSLFLTNASYDFSSKDMGTIAGRQGEGITKANKSRDEGADKLNTLFKCNCLFIFDDTTGELGKLSGELTSLMSGTNKTVAKDDFCFAGDTLILTQRGEVPISDVCIGDLALTRAGFRPIVAKTKALAEVISVERNGKKTWVTPQHNYILPTSKVEAQKLKDCLVLSDAEKQKFLNLTELSFAGIPQVRSDTCDYIIGRPVTTDIAGIRACIKKFSSKYTAQFQNIFAFITSMAIRLITIPTIYRLSTAPNINDCTGKPLGERQLAERIWTTPENLQTFGTVLRPGMSSTFKSVKKRGKRWLQYFFLAKFVKKPLKLRPFEENSQNFVPTTVNPNTGAIPGSTILKKIVWFAQSPLPKIDISPLKPVLELVPVDFVAKQRKKSFVYNITVQDEHEYFADGALVANCDALRYAVMDMPWDWEAIGKMTLPAEPTEEMDEHMTDEERRAHEIRERRGENNSKKDDGWQEMEDEFTEWNERY